MQYAACYQDNVVALQELLIRDDFDLSLRDPERGATLLMWSAMGGAQRCVALLLASGCALDEQDALGQTALMHAVQNKHLVTAHMLAEAGANLFVRDGEQHTLLHWAVYGKDTQMVVYLINRGLKVNDVDVHGANMLHWASVRGHYALIPLLLERGANRDARDANGKTPLELAEGGVNLDAVVSALKQKDSADDKRFFRWKFTAIGFCGSLMVWSLGEMFPWLFLALIPLCYLLFTNEWMLQNVVGFRRDRQSGFFLGFMLATCLGALYYNHLFLRWMPNVSPWIFEAGMTLILVLLFRVHADQGRIPRNFHVDNVDWSRCRGFCAFCMSQTPVRAKHCRKCDACFARFDHHCEFLDVCVALHNQRYFLLLVMWTALMHLIWLWKAVDLFGRVGYFTHPALLAFALLESGQFVLTAMLGFGQARLMLLDSTTYEETHGPIEERRRYSRGAKTNILQYWGVAGREQRDYGRMWYDEAVPRRKEEQA